MNTPSTTATPRRFIQALIDATKGVRWGSQPAQNLQNRMPERTGLPVRPGYRRPNSILFLCEHDVFPFFGDAYVGYIANENIIGISKLTRLVRLFAQRFSVQERIGQQVADTIRQAILLPHGVAVYLEGDHLCVQMRGVKGVGSADTHYCLAREFCQGRLPQG